MLPSVPQEEREGRKNHISRTRSGRISRPPRHMMKDFKHLHPINFNDDDKDKDAPSIGYSDYNVQNQVESEEKPIEPGMLASTFFMCNWGGRGCVIQL